MKKLFLLFVMLGMSLFLNASNEYTSIPSVSNYQPVPDTKRQAFLKKWSRYYNLFCQGEPNYGWSKAFFTEMMNALPEQFCMKRELVQDGITYYSFAFALEDVVMYSGALGFSGAKLHSFQLDSWGWDLELLYNFIEAVDWKYYKNQSAQ